MVSRSKIVLVFVVFSWLTHLIAIPKESINSKVMRLDAFAPNDVKEHDTVKLAREQNGDFDCKLYSVENITSEKNQKRERAYKIFNLVDKEDLVPYIIKRGLTVKYRICTAGGQEKP